MNGNRLIKFNRLLRALVNSSLNSFIAPLSVAEKKISSEFDQLIDGVRTFWYKAALPLRQLSFYFFKVIERHFSNAYTLFFSGSVCTDNCTVNRICPFF